MTSCQTWTTSSHIRHPWFDASIMKRKHRETVSPDDDLGGVIGPVSAASAAKPPPPKRRRCSNLEQGFAHLTLGSTPVVAAGGSGKTFVSPPPMYSTMREMPMASVDADMPLASTSTSTYPTDRLPYTIEEPPAPEVKMKVSSWYEPEPDRIIITDMDSFTQEDEKEEDGSLIVNPVLLDRIRSNTLESSSKPSAPPPNQALVLFKPLALDNKEANTERMQEEERRRKQAATERVTENKEGVTDDDAMDVEP
ncbi:hypothetical protein CVT25_012246 [Psilocybe cyanescens]|uniref:Uncharacterized protein n=1 Tax=Psilocybe cyanescens TaxID=93625 RepID=A0A409XFP3_PSICY|nr:hypothetical protein CVT25_012246 [Psilocybe cyanescens]